MQADREFTILYSPSHSKHAPVFHGLGSTIYTPHVETPRRANCIFEVAKALTANSKVILSEREASKEELLTIHTEELIDYIMNAYASLHSFTGKCEQPADAEVVPCVAARGGIAQKARFKPKAWHLQGGLFCIDYSTPIGEFTAIAATKSAALAIDGAKLVRDGKDYVFAICRPPGHHAGTSMYGGYCYFNNVALAAEQLKSNGLVCILDIDYHHGNGTQDIFYERNDVLYISTHGDPTFEYPYYSGGSDETGAGEGVGYNINYPLPAGTDYTTFRPIIVEICEKIKSMGVKTLILSFGSDTAKGDPICTFELVPEDYFDIGQQLKALGLPTLVVQEGGYSADDVLGPVEAALLRGLL